MTYNFISGLPRSGSTLLAALLRQNPDFHASIMSPLGYSVVALHQSLNADNEAAIFYTDTQRINMIEAIFDAYYECQLSKMIFDNNRRWCAQAALLAKVFPGSKIICCVRPLAHIIDSVERLVQKHPTMLSSIFGRKVNMTVYERAQMLMSPAGLVGYAYNAFREFFYGPFRENMILVDYRDLAQTPSVTMRRIHNELSLPDFAYDFKHIAPIPLAAEFDASVGTPGLHDLKPQVLYQPQNSILPPDIYTSLPQPFWIPVKKPETFVA